MFSTTLAILQIVQKLLAKPHPVLARVLRLNPVDVAFVDLLLGGLAAFHFMG